MVLAQRKPRLLLRSAELIGLGGEVAALVGGEQAEPVAQADEHPGPRQAAGGAGEQVELVVREGRLDEQGGDVEAGLGEPVADRELVVAWELGDPLEHPEREVLHAQGEGVSGRIERGG